MEIKSFETALSTMKMLTVPEWNRYANHSCADYVAQEKTFTYNKMDCLKDMNYNQLDKETPDFESPAQAHKNSGKGILMIKDYSSDSMQSTQQCPTLCNYQQGQAQFGNYSTHFITHHSQSQGHPQQVQF